MDDHRKNCWHLAVRRASKISGIIIRVQNLTLSLVNCLAEKTVSVWAEQMPWSFYILKEPNREEKLISSWWKTTWGWGQDGRRVGSQSHLSPPNYLDNFWLTFKSSWKTYEFCLRFKREELECYSEKILHFYQVQHIFGHSAVSNMTRRKKSPQRKNQKHHSLPQSYKILNTIQCQKANSEAQL